MKRLDKVLMYLKELDFQPDLNNFENKLIIQKVVCLMKLLKFDVKYDFSIHIRGTYSRDLTEDLYQNKKKLYPLNITPKLTKEEINQLFAIREISDELNSKYLEIMATYAYFRFAEKKNEEDSIIKLKKLKPFFSDRLIAVGISKTKELFFKPNKKEIQEMKSEFNAWENIAL